jgi:hypothetical protein
LQVTVISSNGNIPIATVKVGNKILKLNELIGLTCFLKVDPSSTVKDLKKQIHHFKPWLYPERQELRLQPRSKAISENEIVQNLGLKEQGKLYLKVHLVVAFHPTIKNFKNHLLTFTKFSFIFTGFGTSDCMEDCFLTGICWSVVCVRLDIPKAMVILWRCSTRSASESSRSVCPKITFFITDDN